MNDQQAELFEKIRQQFDSAPYPNIPLEKTPEDEYGKLFLHSIITSYYLRNQQLTATEGKVILDAGCGSGYKSLVLATANPGAKIVGVDLSKESVALAKQRLEFYGFKDSEFIVASIEDLPTLGFEFDYINCDEVLYLLPDIAQGLQAMKAVLKPEGIIRANLHSAIQRFNFFRAQQVFKIIGLMDSNPEDLEIEIAQETLRALKDSVNLKIITWNSQPKNVVETKEWILMNYLFQGDKGYTIPELFSALRSANLEFISMVNWRQWELLDLFEDPDNLPAFWAMSLPEATVEQCLQLYELLNPRHRLLDFWCGHPGQVREYIPLADWPQDHWQTAVVHLHPQLRSPKIRQDLIDCIQKNELFVIGDYVPEQQRKSIYIKTPMTAALLPLWDGPQPIQALVARFLKINPVDPTTLNPLTETQAMEAIIDVLMTLETPMYVLLAAE